MPDIEHGTEPEVEPDIEPDQPDTEPTTDPADDPDTETADKPDTETADKPDASTEQPDRGPVTGKELLRDLVKPGRGQVILAVILLIVGMAWVAQVRTHTEQSPYSSLRRTELIQMLDNLNQESRRLGTEINQQEAVKRQLESGVGNEQVARQEAQKRLETLRILAGTAPAEGPGIILVIRDPAGKLTPDILLNAIEELRDAGAEVIEINDTIRIVASSWVGRTSEGLVIDGKPVRTPITIEAIGDGHALEEGARFRGGLVSEVEGPRVGGSVTITQSTKVSIRSLHQPRPNQHARPA